MGGARRAPEQRDAAKWRDCSLGVMEGYPRAQCQARAPSAPPSLTAFDRADGRPTLGCHQRRRVGPLRPSRLSGGRRAAESVRLGPTRRPESGPFGGRVGTRVGPTRCARAAATGTKKPDPGHAREPESDRVSTVGSQLPVGTLLSFCAQSRIKKRFVKSSLDNLSRKQQQEAHARTHYWPHGAVSYLRARKRTARLNVAVS